MNEKLNLTWDKLKKINTHRVISSMYIWIFIVPILIKVFEKVNQESYNFCIFNEVIEIQLELPFSLILFYFSAISFAIGNLLLTVKCPLIVRENNSFSDFQNEGKKLKQLKPYIEDINFNWDKLAREVDKKINIHNSLYRSLDSTNKNIENMREYDLKEEDPKNYFWEIYEEAKKARGNYRFLTNIFYALGFFLMSIVLVQNFYFIVKVLFNQNI